MFVQAIRNLKANAGVSQVENAKPEPSVELPKPKSEGPVELHNPGPPGSRELPRSQLSSGLPPDFFDNNDSQKPKRSKNICITSTIKIDAFLADDCFIIIILIAVVLRTIALVLNMMQYNG